MAEVLVFCSKTQKVSATETVGFVDVNLRHPMMFKRGYTNKRITFPMDETVLLQRQVNRETMQRRTLAVLDLMDQGYLSRSRVLDMLDAFGARQVSSCEHVFHEQS